MNINCIKCNKEYHIPDEQVEGRRIHFFCDNCNHKIIIINSRKKMKESWASYRGLTDKTLTLKNILDGIFFSFNLKNILLSFFVLLSFSIFLFLLTLIVSQNMSFFSSRPYFSGFSALIIFIILAYIYDIHLYLLSLNSFNRINTGISMIFSTAKYKITNDLKLLFILSIGILIVFAFLFMPVSLMSLESGIIYEGLLHIIFAILAIMIILVFYLKNIIYAFIASKTRGAGHTFKSIFQFIAVENINIPIYIFFINIISLIAACAMLTLFIGAILFIGIFLSLSSAPDLFSIAAAFGNPAGFHTNLPDLVGTGVILISISSFIILLFIIAYIINLTQTLSAVSIYIMESNPGESVNKNALLITIVAIYIIAVSSLSSVISALSLSLKQ